MNPIEKIKAWSFDNIKKDAEMTMLLLKTYSILFLGNAAPRTCERCMLNYYNEIVSLNNENLKIMEDKLKKTNVATFKKFYSTIAHEHINPDLLTDSKAILFLKHGILKEEQFSKLPEGYKTTDPALEVETDEPNLEVKKTTRKNK